MPNGDRRVTAEALGSILAGRPEFAGLSPEARASLVGVAERVFVPAGQQLLASGHPADAAYLVQSGRLRAVERRAGAAMGEEVALEFGPGEFCALNVVIAQVPIDGSLVARRDSV